MTNHSGKRTLRVSGSNLLKASVLTPSEVYQSGNRTVRSSGCKQDRARVPTPCELTITLEEQIRELKLQNEELERQKAA